MKIRKTAFSAIIMILLSVVCTSCNKQPEKIVIKPKKITKADRVKQLIEKNFKLATLVACTYTPLKCFDFIKNESISTTNEVSSTKHKIQTGAYIRVTQGNVKYQIINPNGKTVLFDEFVQGENTIVKKDFEPINGNWKFIISSTNTASGNYALSIKQNL
jgi:hypothetical protein